MSIPVKIDQAAPDFNLDTFNGESISLSNFQGQKNVLLVFNRGFT
jgi:peroxiredoxin